MRVSTLVECTVGTTKEIILRQIARDKDRGSRRRTIIKQTGVSYHVVEEDLEFLYTYKLITPRPPSQEPYKLTRKGLLVIERLIDKVNLEQFELMPMDDSRVYRIHLGSTTAEDLLSLPTRSIVVIEELSRNNTFRSQQLGMLAKLCGDLAFHKNGREDVPPVYYLGDFRAFDRETLGSFLSIPGLKMCEPDDLPELLDELDETDAPYETQAAISA